MGLILIMLGCSSIFLNKVKDSRDIHENLNNINNLIRIHQFKDAKKAIDKFIRNNPSCMSGYNKLFFLYNVADISSDNIAKDEKNIWFILMITYCLIVFPCKLNIYLRQLSKIPQRLQ